jgi:hypothetical protein
MPFQINTANPPDDSAQPHGDGDQFKLPAATGVDGNGSPCGAIGYPRYELTFPSLSTAGFAWYAAFVGTNLSAVLTSLQVWNPYTSGGAGGWVTYTHAVMHRPRHAGIYGTFYRNVEILFTELY